MYSRDVWHWHAKNHVYTFSIVIDTHTLEHMHAHTHLCSYYTGLL